MKLVEVFMVMLYNLVLVAGASYLFVEHNVSAWIFAIPIIFAASWSTKKKDENSDTGSVY